MDHARTPRGGAGELAELLARDALPGLGTLVATVAHEIQNPVTYVLGNLRELQGILSAETYRGHGLEELVADALEGAERIRRLVGDLLTVSRSTGQGQDPVDVNAVVAATVRLVSRRLEGRARLEQSLTATRTVRGDAARLGQLVLNLLQNAHEACEPQREAGHWIAVGTRNTRSGLTIEVEDSGTGIPANARERVFEPFFTTRESGSGLGLYLCRRIAEEHGGAIHHEVGTGGGSRFVVTLPDDSASSG
ncbi:MAG: HAMP domain-containing sensor histidine kinase [Myxococcota bacterium]